MTFTKYRIKDEREIVSLSLQENARGRKKQREIYLRGLGHCPWRRRRASERASARAKEREREEDGRQGVHAALLNYQRRISVGLLANKIVCHVGLPPPQPSFVHFRADSRGAKRIRRARLYISLVSMKIL